MQIKKANLKYIVTVHQGDVKEGPGKKTSNNQQFPSRTLNQSPYMPRRSPLAENKACLSACLASWAMGKGLYNSHNYSRLPDNAENVNAAPTAALHPEQPHKDQQSHQTMSS